MNRSNTSSPVNGIGRVNTRTRSRASSINDRFGRIAEDEGLDPPLRPTISSRSASRNNSVGRELPGYDLPSRPAGQRSASGFEGPTSLARDLSPAAPTRLAKIPTDPAQINGARNGLRVTKRIDSRNGIFDDDQSDIVDSPVSSELSRMTSWSMNGNDGSDISKKPPPPPPPPSRATKPKPPPPPPMKRSALSTSAVPHY